MLSVDEIERALEQDGPVPLLPAPRPGRVGRSAVVDDRRAYARRVLAEMRDARQRMPGWLQ